MFVVVPILTILCYRLNRMILLLDLRLLGPAALSSVSG